MVAPSSDRMKPWRDVSTRLALPDQWMTRYFRTRRMHQRDRGYLFRKSCFMAVHIISGLKSLRSLPAALRSREPGCVLLKDLHLCLRYEVRCGSPRADRTARYC